MKKSFLRLALITAFCSALFFALSISASANALGLTPAGGESGADWDYGEYDAGSNPRTLVVKSGTPLTFSGNYTKGYDTDYARIVVAEGVEANLIFSGLHAEAPSPAQPLLDLSKAGDCTITLAAGTENVISGFMGNAGDESGPAILLPKNGTLTIKGSGKLTANGGPYWPGIGYGEPHGEKLTRLAGWTLRIEGGTVISNGGPNGPGIGGYYNDTCGSVYITGGSVTANGGVNAAGIGTGAIDDRDGNYGFVFISGNAEKVEATGGEYGAGIGTGMRSAIEGYDVAQNHFEVYIHGVDVTAKGGFYAAGIGGGQRTNGCKVSISSGNVVAEGSYTVGIGGGGGVSDNGSLITPMPGNAFITVNRLPDNYDFTDFSGIITYTYGDKKGTTEVYGDQDLGNYTIEAGETWVIPYGATLTVPRGETLTINGTLNHQSTPIYDAITVYGSLAGTGSVNPRLSHDPPGRPELAAASYDSITLKEIEPLAGSVQYGVSEEGYMFPVPIDWQDSPVFTGLQPDTYYWFYAKYLGDNFYNGTYESLSGYYNTTSMTPSADEAVIDYRAETVSFAAGLEVNSQADFMGENISSGSSITGYIGQTIYLRRSPSAGVAGSEAVAVEIPARPGVYPVRITNSIEGTTLSADYYYSFEGPEYDGEGWTQGGGEVVKVAPGETLYTYFGATDSQFKSEVYAVTAPERAETPSPEIDYRDEAIAASAAWQYKLDGTSWRDCTDEMPLSGLGWDGGELEIQFRIPHNNAADGDPGNYASEVAELAIPARPAAPELELDMSSESVTVGADYEYNLGEGWIPGVGAVALEAGATLSVRVPAAESSFHGFEQSISAPERPAAPAVPGIDYAAETVKTTAGLEYRLPGGEWTRCTANMSAAAFGWDGEAAVIEFRTPANETAYASEIAELAIPARPAAPEGVRGGSGRISGVNEGMEYRPEDEAAWTRFEGGSESGLSAGNYLVRYAATDSAFASESVTVSVSSAGNPPDPTYKPIVDEGEGGEVGVEPERPEPGDTVIIRPEPEDGYETDDVTVTDKDGGEVEVRPRPDGSFEFTQPEGAVHISVTFRPADGLPFEDVKPGDWFYGSVDYVYRNGLMDGVSGALFAPDGPMTRAMVWAILARMDGEEITGSDWIEDARAWAVASGVSDGTDPNGLVTREQLATMLWRYAGEPEAAAPLDAFGDAASVSSWARDGMSWATGQGIITGLDGGRLAPQGSATRAQAAAMLARFAETL